MALFGPLARLVIGRLRWFLRHRRQPRRRDLALRHQLLVLQRQINRARFTETDRAILAAFAGVLDRRRLAEVFLIVKPQTGIGWHRRPVARRWTQPPSRKPGRPPIDGQLRALIARIATENPTRGYRRVHGTDPNAQAIPAACAGLWVPDQ